MDVSRASKPAGFEARFLSVDVTNNRRHRTDAALGWNGRAIDAPGPPLNERSVRVQRRWPILHAARQRRCCVPVRRLPRSRAPRLSPAALPPEYGRRFFLPTLTSVHSGLLWLYVA